MSRAGLVCLNDFQPGITWGEPARARTKFSINGLSLSFWKWHKAYSVLIKDFFSILSHLLRAYAVLCTSLLFKVEKDYLQVSRFVLSQFFFWPGKHDYMENFQPS